MNFVIVNLANISYIACSKPQFLRRGRQHLKSASLSVIFSRPTQTIQRRSILIPESCLARTSCVQLQPLYCGDQILCEKDIYSISGLFMNTQNTL